jgi:hypothetical protein
MLAVRLRRHLVKYGCRVIYFICSSLMQPTVNNFFSARTRATNKYISKLHTKVFQCLIICLKTKTEYTSKDILYLLTLYKGTVMVYLLL